MITIESIDIEEFRGIRKLHCKLDKSNFGICGPNGTGKSGIVDAIEFALTGDITRLSGSGSGDLLLRTHGPHVDSRKHPERSKVRLRVYAKALGKSIDIERCVATPASVSVSPSDQKTRAIIDHLAMHPEFALSRREIVKYIITPPGQRSKDVQTLLRLDQIEKVRASLQKVANDYKKEHTSAKGEDVRARSDLAKHLGLGELKKSQLLQAINEKREVLGLEAISDLAHDTNLKAGVIAVEKPTDPAPRIGKRTAEGHLDAFQQAYLVANSKDVAAKRESANCLLVGIRDNADALLAFRQQVLVSQGLALLDHDACPLCDVEWDIAALKSHLNAKQAAAAATSQELKNVETLLAPVVTSNENLSRAAKELVQLGKNAKPQIVTAALSNAAIGIDSATSAVKRAYSDPSGLADGIADLGNKHWAIEQDVAAEVTAIGAYVASIPEPSKEEAAREFLIIAQEKYELVRTNSARVRQAEEAAKLSLNVSDTYGKASTEVLEGIYKSVEADFTDFYRLINNDDENQFTGSLSTPSPAKLAFDVDFYGRGKFPPGAYHSEGHQDGMGLCLYLALMKHTLGTAFTFAVLDDVLMSVDAGHRREVCSLLKKRFPETQFILTTHDPFWLQYMRSDQLIAKSMTFAGWTVEGGPNVWRDVDVWDSLQEKLSKNDVSGAAAQLRWFLEHVATLVAGNLRASVEYRSSGQYDLGDLLQPVLLAFRKLLEDAKKAATSWGHDVTSIVQLQDEFSKKVAESNAEQWAINKALHYNQWATLQPKELLSVVGSYRALLESIRCSNAMCREYLYVSPTKGPKENLRCGCGATNFNLKKK
ncbi:MAG: AAA family ATPase [Gammaproteobacteria bacterium]|nr:AAA family ATPase [Gammaproteobacteria bacterium]